MRFGLTLFFVTGLAFGRTETAPVRVHLDEAKRYAIENNFEVSALRQQAKEREALQGKSKAGFFPTLGVAGGVESTQGGQQTALGYLYANYNIFRGFADTYQAQIASIDAEVAAIRLRQLEFRTGLAVEEKFNLYLLKKILIGQKQEAVKLNDSHKAMAARRQSSGLAASSDVMEFELRDALLRSDLVLLTQELEEVRIQLKTILGEQIGGNIEPVGGLAHQHLKSNLMDYLASVHESSETIRLANRELARANVESKLWRSTWLPKLDLQAKVGYLNFDARPAGGGPGMMGMALVSWDLFSGFSTYWERKEGEAKQLRAEAQLKRAIQTTVMDTETEFRRLKSVQDRVDIEDKNEDRAKRYYDAVMNEYRRGVKNSADVKVAAELLFETRARRETYKYDFLKERVDLERAIGKPIVVEVHED